MDRQGCKDAGIFHARRHLPAVPAGPCPAPLALGSTCSTLFTTAHFTPAQRRICFCSTNKETLSVQPTGQVGFAPLQPRGFSPLLSPTTDPRHHEFSYNLFPAALKLVLTPVYVN